jgi:hypothetical protein
MIKHKIGLLATYAVAFMLAGASAKATTIITFAANGATGEADFTFETNSLTLTLKNTTVNPRDVAFNLSGLEFTLSGGTGATLTDETSPKSRTVNSDGTYTDAPGQVNGFANVGWVSSASSATGILLDVLAGSGNAGPAHTIIGLPAADNKYDAANNSIRSNGPHDSHNPFLASSITFTYSFTGGVDANTTVKEMQAQFGTSDGALFSVCNANCPGVNQTGGQTPEPGTMLLTFAGVGLLGIGSFRKVRS